jgi:hypothetical protein
LSRLAARPVSIRSTRYGRTDSGFGYSLIALRDVRFAICQRRLRTVRRALASSARILDARARTPPTLIGTTLYVRDRKTMAAYDLGAH